MKNFPFKLTAYVMGLLLLVLSIIGIAANTSAWIVGIGLAAAYLCLSVDVSLVKQELFEVLNKH